MGSELVLAPDERVVLAGVVGVGFRATTGCESDPRNRGTKESVGTGGWKPASNVVARPEAIAPDLKDFEDGPVGSVVLGWYGEEGGADLGAFGDEEVGARQADIKQTGEGGVRRAVGIMPAEEDRPAIARVPVAVTTLWTCRETFVAEHWRGSLCDLASSSGKSRSGVVGRMAVV